MPPPEGTPVNVSRRGWRTSRPWQALTSRPHLPIVAYLGVTGWAAVIGADHGSLGLIPPWLAIMWTLAVAIGGTLATIGILGLWKVVEAVGSVLLTYGAVVYGVLFGIGLWPRWTPIAVAAAITAMCVIRLRVLYLARTAETVAAELAESESRDSATESGD